MGALFKVLRQLLCEYPGCVSDAADEVRGRFRPLGGAFPLPWSTSLDITLRVMIIRSSSRGLSDMPTYQVSVYATPRIHTAVDRTYISVVIVIIPTVTGRRADGPTPMTMHDVTVGVAWPL